jgi:tRNA(Arg) A34 adenosine deaminase TadA
VRPWRWPSRRRRTLTLDGLGLFTNAAPCAMCVAAMVTAGIAVLGFGAPRAAGTWPDVGVGELVRRSGPRRIEVYSGLLLDETAAQLERWS